MKRYKNWMAIILTLILVVTGTASPVLAAELVSASGELIPAEEELVSAAALSDDNELDVAAAPEITEIEEHEDMAEIPAGEADVSTDEADVPTDEADVPTDAVTPTDDLDMHEDDEDYIESLKRKQQEQQRTTGLNTTST